MRRAPKIVPLLVAGLLALGACAGADNNGGTGASGGFPMTVQSCGREVTVEEPPERVMTMGPEAPTLMAAAGAAEEIDIRAAEFGYPLGRYEDALADVRLISSLEEPSREVIIAQEPDLVIHYGLSATTPEDLAAAGIDSIVVSGLCDEQSGANPDGDVDFDDVYRDIELYARMVGTEEAASRTVADLRGRVAAARERFRGVVGGTREVRTAAAVYFSGGALGGYGNQNMTHTQIEALGLTNVFADVEERTFELSPEELIARDPDVIVLLHGNTPDESVEDAKRKLGDLPGAGGTTAVREDRIIPLRVTYLVGSPLAVDGLETMAEGIGRFE